MRKITLIFYVFALLFAQGAWAQDLFISEYVEPSTGNTKVLELYNPTTADIDLSGYTIMQANNGNDWGNTSTSTDDVRYILTLSGTLAPGAVYVIANSQSVQEVLDKADLLLAYSNDPIDGANVPSFNGDDAIGLFKGTTLIDAIGIPTERPSSGWDVAAVAAATKDHTLVRKSTITQGNANWATAAGTDAATSEWEVYDAMDFTHIGWHITPPSNEAEILSFVLAEEISTAIISTENAMVTSTVAWDADLGALEPTITVSEGAQVTATTLPVVFNGVDPVEYIVTAADGVTTKLWDVYVLQAAAPEMLTIKEIQETTDASGDSPYLDQIVMTKGVVVTVDARGFYLQDGAGAWNGVYVYQGSAPTAVAGDSVKVTATVDEYNGLTELVSPEYTVLNQGNTVAAATVATLAEMNSEMYEAVLVTIEDVKCIVPEKSKNWTVANATDTLVIRNGIEDGYAAVLFQEFTSITGFGQQYNATYQLFPRSIADIVEVDMVTLTFNVDMTAPIDAGTFVAGTDVLYVTGDFAGWNEPGKGNSVLMADADANKVYSATIAMAVNHGAILYKYFKNAGWDGGEWAGDPNRTLTIADVDYVIDPADVWAVTGIEDNLDMSAISVFPNPFNNVITINGLANAKQIRVSNMLGQEVMNVTLAGQESKEISTDNLNRGVYFVTITDGNNNAKTVKVVKQ
ncbi:MAG: lamin tail domain-containing protein [Salinivirgaceae bacterium]